MAVDESTLEQATGKLVALEGDTESISVQLRLLPPSNKILVLPPLGKSSAVDSTDDFDARAFVRDIHRAYIKRTETARSFLQSSTSIHPRLVFLNGGAISARATCIEKISENLTNGEVGPAEIIFNDIVKDGVAGLMKHGDGGDAREGNGANMVDIGDNTTNADCPTSEAVRSSAASNRQAELTQSSEVPQYAPQPRNGGTGNNIASIIAHRSGSDPGIPQSWRFGSIKQAAELPKAIFTTGEGDQIVRTVLEVPLRNRRLPLQDPKVVEEKRSTFGPRDNARISNLPYQNGLTNQYEESEDDGGYDDTEPVSSGDGTMSIPATPAVVFGEACLVDVQSASPSRSVRRAQSFDRFFPSDAKSEGASLLAPPQLKHTTSVCHIRGRSHSPGGENEKRYSKFPTLPRSTFVKASEMTIRRSPTLNGSTRTNSSSSEAPLPTVNVDRATNRAEAEKMKVIPLKRVFHVEEDMIIHLIDDKPNEILESVIQFYRSGRYLVVPSPQAVSTIPDSPTSEYSSNEPQYFDGKQSIRPNSYQAMLPNGTGYEGVNDHLPAAMSGHYSAGQTHVWSGVNPFNRAEDSRIDPPTPIPTPPLVPSIGDRIVDLAPVNSSSAISIQNSLRQLLGVHFPAGEHGVSQHYYPVAPEIDRLWKPVFRNDEYSTIGNEGRTVDQIIALGCEAGVSREYFYQISGQIERLGAKRDGLNRSGKLDISYLIGNAMQMYSTLPLINQATYNPFSDPKVLAALLVSQLEAYLAANTNTRLLILQFQASHLPVILALREILGTDLLKVAGIIDSLASDPPSFASSRTPVNPLSNESVAERWKESARNARLQSFSRTTTALDGDVQNKINARASLTPVVVSFSRASYVLSSTATDSEITNFLSSIWKCLMERSAFYTPEPEIKPIMIVERPPIPPIPTSASNNQYEHPPRDSSYASSIQRKGSRNASTSNNSNSDARSIRSVLSTRHRSTSRSSTRRAHHESMAVSLPIPKIAPSNTSGRRMTLGTEKLESEKGTWENFYIGEDDSDDDEFDRRIMGREMAHIVPEVRKFADGHVQVPRNKKKALKWLGLA